MSSSLDRIIFEESVARLRVQEKLDLLVADINGNKDISLRFQELEAIFRAIKLVLEVNSFLNPKQRQPVSISTINTS